MDSLDNSRTDTQDNTATVTTGRPRDRPAHTAAIVAVVASVLALIGEATGPYLSALVDSWNLEPRIAFNLFSFVNIYVVGALGIAAVLLAARSLKKSPSRRGLAGAAVALGMFHIAHMLIIPLMTLFGPRL